MNKFLSRIVREEWRGLPSDRRQEDRFVQPGEHITRLLNEIGLSDRLSEEEVAGAWSDVTGPFLSQHAMPTGIKKGVLVIKVLQPTVHFSLEGMRSELLGKFQQRFPDANIRDIRFVLG